MSRTIRIGCASGFWGDSLTAAPQLVERGAIDYLVFDYLAEITMSILGRMRARDPARGYATDFVTETVPRVARGCAERGIRIIANAGGVNPAACAAAVEAELKKLGLKLRVAHVEGDDLIGRTAEFRHLTEMFTGAPFPDNCVSMNAYLGGFPIARALAEGADIVITGRCVDSAVTLGALIHEFGWGPADHDRLAGGSLAGHIVECGAQACGGLFTDWERVPDWADIGYAIAEVSEDGSFVTTKPEGTGGLVVPGTVGEQILYEIGDPQAYFLADVVCDFSQVTLEQIGRDRVRVAGARGLPPTSTYKCSLTHEDGWRVGQYLTIGGLDAAKKARRTGEEVLARMGRMLRERNLAPFEEVSLEVVGAEDSYGPHARDIRAREAMLKLAAKHEDPQALSLLLRELASSATSMAAGTHGLGGFSPKPQKLVRHFSCLVPKAEVPVHVVIGGERIAVPIETAGGYDPAVTRRPDRPAPPQPGDDWITLPLVALAYVRSGDKGDISNVGVMARAPEYLPCLEAALTEDAVAAWYAHRIKGGTVTRYALPGFHALNFVMTNALGGGGIASLSNDPQGKAYGQMLLEFPVPVPPSVARARGGGMAATA